MNAPMQLAKSFIRLIVCLVFACDGQWAFAQTNFWEQTNGPYGGIIVELAINSSNGHIFAGTSGGIFRSTNNGDSWTAVNTGLTNPAVGSFAINPVTQVIFAGTIGSGVFRSSNNGDSWTAVNTSLTTLFIWFLAINPVTGDIFAGTTDGVFRSTDNGDSWAKVTAGLTNLNVGSLAINASGDIFAGTGGGGLPLHQ